MGSQRVGHDWTDWNCLLSVSFSPSQPLTSPGCKCSTLVVVHVLILFFILEYRSSLSSYWNIILALNYALFLLFYTILYSMRKCLSHICRRHSYWSLCPCGGMTCIGSGVSPVTCFDQVYVGTMSCQPFKSAHNPICNLIFHLSFFVPLHRLCPLQEGPSTSFLCDQVLTL